ncbi:MAG TPA: tRNA pseudouridine(13) synthase TruD, partial [Phycisphaerales bacterium]|nr:tRNA pseudouridine(13) synthase TruD [Phycisphaerales bacterium]
MTIRRQPSDFRVVERLDRAFAAALAMEPSQGTPFAVYRLSKTSLTTPEAVSQFAKRLGAGQGDVEYGGLKDKHAETLQHVSVVVRGKEQAARLPSGVAAPGWTAERVGWSGQAMSAKVIAANAFTLVVRDLSKTESDNMTRRSRRLLAPAAAGEETSTTLLFTN